jgi:hypothetical protein
MNVAAVGARGQDYFLKSVVLNRMEHFEGRQKGHERTKGAFALFAIFSVRRAERRFCMQAHFTFN